MILSQMFVLFRGCAGDDKKSKSYLNTRKIITSNKITTRGTFNVDVFSSTFTSMSFYVQIYGIYGLQKCFKSQK